MENEPTNLGERVLVHVLNCGDEEFATLSVKRLAALHGVSRGHLSRAFRREVGLCLRILLHHERLERAKEIMRREPGLPLGQVRRRVGFEQTGYFRRLFLAHFGLAPEKMRRKDRGRQA
jgi:transcriptional regulator GlxA family with amidase domain